MPCVLSFNLSRNSRGAGPCGVPNIRLKMCPLTDEDFDIFRKILKGVVGIPFYWNSEFEVLPEPAAGWDIEQEMETA